MATSDNEPIVLEVKINASRNEVWKMWTTSDGARSFFAPDAWIEDREGGAYELYFNPANPEGSRGSEGMKIVAFRPPEMLAFTWNPPPHLPRIRQFVTVVVITLADDGVGGTRLRLVQTGFGEGTEWNRAHEFFSNAWALVGERIQRRFTDGPLDWSTISLSGARSPE